MVLRVMDELMVVRLLILLMSGFLIRLLNVLRAVLIFLMVYNTKT